MKRAPKATDRRVQRTRRTLSESLIALILERGWDGVSVQDVCDRADIGRSTFYAHFAGKEDLLTSGFDELRKALREQRASQAGGKPLDFARGLIEHAHDPQHRRLFRAIFGRRSGQAMQKRFRRLLIDLVQEDLAGLAPAGPRLNAAVHYIAGAFFELLIWWLDTRSALQPSEMEEFFDRLTAPVLAEVRNLSSR